MIISYLVPKIQELNIGNDSSLMLKPCIKPIDKLELHKSITLQITINYSLCICNEYYSLYYKSLH